MPISIAFELIVEQQSYLEELTGGDKQQENLGGLLDMLEVLRSRYGRLYIHFGQCLRRSTPVKTEQLEDRKGPLRKLTPTAQRSLVERIAHRAMHQINDGPRGYARGAAVPALMAHRDAASAVTHWMRLPSTFCRV